MTADHLQAFIDLMSYGGINPDGTTSKPMSKGYMLQFSAVLQDSFRFAVFASLTTTITAAAVAAEEINQKVNDLNHAKDHAPNEDEQSEEEGKQQEDLFKCHDNHLIFVG